MEHIENVYPRSMSNVFLEAWTVVKIDTHETRWAAEVDDKVLQALISLERVNWGFTTEEEKGFSNKYQNTRYILNNIKAVKYIYICVFYGVKSLLWDQKRAIGWLSKVINAQHIWRLFHVDTHTNIAMYSFSLYILKIATTMYRWQIPWIIASQWCWYICIYGIVLHEIY